MRDRLGLRCVVLLGLGAGLARAESVTLVERGVARCCVVVGSEADFREPAQADWAPKVTLLKWAAEDVTAYLGKMSGASVPCGAEPVEGLVPIYVGCAPQPGRLSKTTPYGDAYVVDVSAQRIVLHGESRRAVYYAAAQLLHDAGVRWYAPGEIGEVVPQRRTVSIPTGRREFARTWFAAREALHRLRLVEAERQGAAFLANYQAGFAKYPVFFGPNRSWSPNIERYFQLFHNRAFEEAGRIAREAQVVHAFTDEWRAHLNAGAGGVKPPRPRPPTEETSWRTLKTFSASLDEQGLPFFRGVIWYRQQFTLAREVRNARPLKLWFGGVDSKAHVWLNGQDLGEQRAANFGPLEFDISAAVRRDADNDLLVAVDNTFPNEIGTGGLLRPVLVCAPRQ